LGAERKAAAFGKAGGYRYAEGVGGVGHAHFEGGVVADDNHARGFGRGDAHLAHRALDYFAGRLS
jgi:hypothetical protein